MLTKVKFIKDYNYVPYRGSGLSAGFPKKFKVGQEYSASKIGNKITINPGNIDVTDYVKEIYAEYTQTVTDSSGNVTTKTVSNIPKPDVKKEDTKTDGTKETEKKEENTNVSASEEPKKLFGFNRKYVIIGGISLLVIATGLIVYFGFIKKK